MKRTFGLFLSAALALCSCSENPETNFIKPNHFRIVNGSREHDARIVDLTEGQLLAFGYLHELYVPGGAYCSGTLISPRVVATARHCVCNDREQDCSSAAPTNASKIGFSIGQETSGNPTATFAVESVHVHDSEDAALLVLKQDATKAVPGLTPIEINRNSLLSGYLREKVQVVGYGHTRAFGSGGYNEGRFFAEVVLAGISESYITVNGGGIEGLCDGDSGGPALLTVDGQVVVLAVESQGDMSCVGEDEMTRLDKLASWIDGITPEISVGGNAPVGWRCSDNFYGDGACDCGCGVLDRDCLSEKSTSCDYCFCGEINLCGFNSVVEFNDNTACQENFEPPQGWTCSELLYGNGECDCGCGARDIDCKQNSYDECKICWCASKYEANPCDRSNRALHHNPALCERDVPADWTCAEGSYSDGECDCGCSILDPDCVAYSAALCEECHCDDWGGVCTGRNVVYSGDNTTCEGLERGDSAVASDDSSKDAGLHDSELSKGDSSSCEFSPGKKSHIGSLILTFLGLFGLKRKRITC